MTITLDKFRYSALGFLHGFEKPLTRDSYFKAFFVGIKRLRFLVKSLSFFLTLMHFVVKRVHFEQKY